MSVSSQALPVKALRVPCLNVVLFTYAVWWLTCSRPGAPQQCFSSRAMYAQGGKILACAACEDSQSVASASSSGSVHVWRVEYTSRSGGAPDRYTGIIGIPQPLVSHCQWHHTS